MDDETLKQEEAAILAEEAGQSGGETAGGETGGGEDQGKADERRPSRFQQRISELVAARKAAEDRAVRLEAQLEAERSKAQPGSERRALTPAEQRALVRQKFAAGEIDDDTRVELLARISAAEIVESQDAERHGRSILADAGQEIAEWVRLEPSLNEVGSQLNAEVAAAYRRLVARGFPEDLRTQAAAVEQVLGPLDRFRQRRAVSDYTADRMPRGGAGVGRSGQERPKQPEKRGEALFARLTDEALAYLRSMGETDEQIKADLEYADEGTLWRAGRLKSR